MCKLEKEQNYSWAAAGIDLCSECLHNILNYWDTCIIMGM